MVALSKRIERDKDNGAMIIQRRETREFAAQNYKVPPPLPSLTNNNMSAVQRKASSERVSELAG
jgi:hypothetical protein